MVYDNHINTSAPDYAPNAAELKATDSVQEQNGIIPEYERKRWIWFITGPTACGKTTIAKALAENLNFTFVEGDDVGPPNALPQSCTDDDR